MKIRIHESRLVACDAQGLTLHDISNGEPRLLAKRHEPTELNAFTMDPTGERVTEIQAGHFARSFTRPGQEGHWASQHSSVGLYDLDLQEVALYDMGQRLGSSSLALSPDGTRLAAINRGAGVLILEARTGRIESEFEGSIASGVSWSPDGRYVAAGDTDQDDGALYLIDLEAPGGGARRELPHPSTKTPLYDSPYYSVFSGDGEMVIFSSAAWGLRGITAYHVPSGEERWALSMDMPEESEEEEFWEALDLSFADGGKVLLAGVEEGIHAIRARDGEPLTALTCEGATSIHFAPDDLRRRVWFTVEGELAWEEYPGDWG